MQPTTLSASSGDQDSSLRPSAVLTHRSAAAAKLPRTRKSSRKVKTGCLTCKTRRVKCDEQKPYCLRCIKFGIQCDGYLDPVNVPSKEQKLRRTQTKQLILPKRDILQIPGTVSIYRMNAGVGFEDELNGHCFRIYLEETARQINGPFPNPLWGKLIPQISEMEPFVRHAIIAIGALEKHSKSQVQRTLPGTVFKTVDYQYALRLYEKSLRGMRDAIARGKHDLRNALIACLLVFTFEGMLGNQAAAAAHAESGLNLLFQSAIGDNSGKSWQAQKASTHQHFEEDLLEAFNALDLQILLFMDHRTKNVHEQMKMFQTSIIETMPTKLTSLDQARHFWQLILNRNYHFTKSIQSLDLEKLQEERSDTQWENSANMGQKELLLSDPKEGPMTQKAEHLRYRIDIGRWTLAATRLFDEIAKGENEREKAGAALLMAQTKINHIMLAGTFFTTETAYDVFLPEFTAIVTLSETILPYLLSSYEGGDPRFSIDIGIVAGLFLVGSRCRVDDVRKRAIEMLFSSNYREGIWDALAVAHVANWLRSLEREGLEEGELIPEEKRAILSGINIDLHHKRAMLAAVQRTNEGIVQRDTLVTW